MSDQGANLSVRGRKPKADVLVMGLRTVENGQGGVEAHVDNLVKELDDLGLSVAVATRSRFSGQAYTRGRATRFIPFWAPKSQNWEALVHSLIVSFYAMINRPRIVHVHAIGPSLAVPLLRLAGLKVVTTHHGEDYNREKWGVVASTALRLGEWCQAFLANGRICVSPSLSHRLEERYSRRFKYIPNGVRAQERPAGTDQLDKYGLEPGNYVLTVSRLVPEKRHLDLIEAFALLPPSEARLVLVGDADHDSPYAEAVTARSRTVPNVVMTGKLTGAPLYQLFSHAGVFALPSTHEGLPIALLEAMSFGRNVVASDIAPNLDVCLPPESYHKVGDVGDLSRRLESALADTEAARAGRDWSSLLKMFKWPEIARQTLDVYKSVNPAVDTTR